MKLLAAILADPVETIREADRPAFGHELAITRLERLKGLSGAALFVGTVLLVAIDLLRLAPLPAPAEQVSLASHVLLVALSAAMLVATRHTGDPSALSPRARALYVAFQAYGVLFLFVAFVMTLRFLGNPSVHHVAIFSLAFFFSLHGAAGSLVYLADAVLFVATVGAVAPSSSPDVYLSGLIATFLAWTGSRLVLRGRVRDFLLTRELERTNAELQARNEELARLNAEKNEFMGIAAHDLKNPLNGIVGYTESLLEEPDLGEEERGTYLQKVLVAARRMFDLIKNLLDVNAIERGELRLALSPADLRSTARQVVETYLSAAKSKGQSLTVEASAEPAVLMADPNVLHQVTDNLVSNAVKYAPKGGRIVVRVRASDSTSVLEVEDDGPGLTPADQSRLFGKFARLSAQPTGGEHSTGLGLSIVKRLTEALGGEIRCESEPGQGARFIAEFPRIVS